ncbi:MAG: M1 family metallopeptidase [Anaerolineae bacterium]|nr:M1 family metallopeptidase [Anaerolineae bacterium]MCI0609111.1 M1 family metallopeptidase [Anaerolineae bacterium]
MKKIQFWFMLLCLILLSSWGCQTQTEPVVDGASGIGDPYYPQMGNGGYDVQNYTIALDVDPHANTINGSTTILANATEHLGSFNLDFHALTVNSVLVDNIPAEFSRDEDEMTVTPSKPLALNRPFTVVVNYHGTPELITFDAFPIEMGWSHAQDGTINVWGEPNAAYTWFPNNNHPRDKASYRFEITVPKPWIVAASGSLKETKQDGDKTLFVWEMEQPMASYLASINIDQYELFTQKGPGGMTIRSYFPPDYPETLRIGFNILPSAIDFFDDLFGPYPFDEYGVVISDNTAPCNTVDTALEVQSLSIHCPSEVMASERVIIHELAHQWFGDSISLENWKDIWLKEGLAVYSEWLWESKNDPAALARIAKLHRSGFFDSPASVGEPPPDGLYSDETYRGGALVLQALRLQIGDEAFLELLKTYAERYRYGNAGTDEFIALAEEVSRQDLKGFFDQWLFSQRMPDLPD